MQSDKKKRKANKKRSRKKYDLKEEKHNNYGKKRMRGKNNE